MSETFNRRVLVIDDEQVVRDSFREILTRRSNAAVQALETSAVDLFGESARPLPRSTRTFDFVVDEASNGERGLEMIRASISAGEPYALVFLDVRMPGWDGLTTAKRIRSVDERAEIVFVTAYSDYSIEQIVTEAGTNVGYHCKPFAPDEIRQIATKAVYEWNKLRSLESLIQITGELRTGEKQMGELLRCVLDQVSERLGSRSAAVVSHPGTLDGVAGDPGARYTRRQPGEEGYRAELATGELADPRRLHTILQDLVSSPPTREIVRRGDVLLIPVDEFTVISLIEDERGLHAERLYLLRLFLDTAARALESSRLHAELTKRERLSTLGSALSHVVHDLKQPISVIQAALRLATGAPAGTVDVDELHRMIGLGAEDLLSYIEDLLAFTRNERSALDRTALSELFAGIESKARFALGERQSLLAFDIEPEVEAEVAPRKIQRVILNLIHNAVEAITAADVPAPTVTVTLKRSEDLVIARVADNGPGVPEAILATLFEPFVTHGKAGGLGLGLAICRQIAEAHRGTLDLVASERGAVFELVLPVLSEPPGR